MRWNSVKMLVLASILVLLATGCSSPDINEEQAKAVDKAEQAFIETPEKTNTTSGDVNFYLPSGYQLEEENDYNITMEYKGDLILLFVNPNETESSTLLLDMTGQNKDEYVVYTEFKEEDKVGFLAIKEIDDNSYELVVSIGGVKISTQTATNRLEGYAEQFMDIANSIEQ